MELEDRFNEIRQTFFPRSRPAARYCVLVVDPDGVTAGECCKDNVIRIDRSMAALGGVLLNTLLIHELAHAAAGPWHGQRWRGAMWEVIHKAAEIGRNDLAERLLLNITLYSTSP